MSALNSNWPRGRRRPKRRFPRSDSRFLLLAALFAAVVLLLVGGCTYAKYVQESTVTFTVTDKQAVATGSSGHKYLIYTKTTTYEDTDNLFHTKFSSSDLYGRIRVGSTYRCQVTGVRVPLLSWYQNLISCKVA